MSGQLAIESLGLLISAGTLYVVFFTTQGHRRTPLVVALMLLLLVMLGGHLVDQVVLVDQSPIGKTTRSIPATYVGAFDAIRKLFVAHPQARERGYTNGTFSFNSGKGRCPSCAGNGFEHVEMQFLSDVYLRCGDCNGSRYRGEILQIKVIGNSGGEEDLGAQMQALSIADVLGLTVEEAVQFFSAHEKILRCLEPLVDVGLGYVQ